MPLSARKVSVAFGQLPRGEGEIAMLRRTGRWMAALCLIAATALSGCGKGESEVKDIADRPVYVTAGAAFSPADFTVGEFDQHFKGSPDTQLHWEFVNGQGYLATLNHKDAVTGKSYETKILFTVGNAVKDLRTPMGEPDLNGAYVTRASVNGEEMNAFALNQLIYEIGSTIPHQKAATPTSSSADSAPTGTVASATPSSTPAPAEADADTVPSSPLALGEASAFQKYAADIYTGQAQLPDFAGRDKNYADYRTRIAAGVHKGPNFAGRLVLTAFGCGTECIAGFVTDVSTGRVYDLPVGGEETPELDLRYLRNSRLLRTHWTAQDANSNSVCVYADYVWNGSGFDSVRKEKDSKPCPT